MKKILILCLQFFVFVVCAQTPNQINYQGVARDAYGVPLPMRTLGVRFKLMQGASTTPVFSENQSVTTNSLGLFTTQIGKSTTTLSSVNFEAGNLSLIVGIDTTGGTNFLDLPPQQLVSVPYSIHSGNVPSTYTNGVLTIGKNTFTINTVPALSFTNNILRSGPASNTVLIPVAETTITGTGVTKISSNNYSVSIPAQSLSVSAPNTLSITNGNSVQIVPTMTLTGNVLSVVNATNSVTLPTVSITQGGVANVSGGPYNYNVSVPPSHLLVTNNPGAVTMNTISANNWALNIPPFSVPTITTSGLAQQSQTGNTITINVPVLSYTTGNGALGSGTNIVNITQTLGLNGSIINSGPTSNAINLAPLTPWRDAGATVTLATNSDNVGIGTGSPTEKLDVLGNIRFSGALMPNNLSGSAGQFLMSAGANTPPLWMTGGVLSGGAINYVPKWTSATGLSSSSQLYDDGTNVGVGTNNPQQKLDVQGYIRVGSGSTSADEAWLLYSPTPGLSSLRAGQRGSTEMRLDQSNNAPITFWTSNSEKMRITAGGLVGINNNNPVKTLDVSGTASISSSAVQTGFVAEMTNNYVGSGISGGVLRLNNTGLRSIGHHAMIIDNLTTKNGGNNSTKIGLEINSTGGWGVGGSGGHYNRGLSVTVAGGADGNYPAVFMGGNVGIGNVNPIHRLTIDGPVLDGLNGPNLSFLNTGNNYPLMELFNWSHTEQWLLFNSYFDGSFRSSGTQASMGMQHISGNLNFRTAAVAAPGTNISWTDVFTINGNGNIGVGLTSPSERLEVVGNVEIPATNSYKYASAKTSYATISAASFESINSVATDGTSTGNARHISGGIVGVADNLFATVQLPHEATITAIDVYIYDNDPLRDVTATLVTFHMPLNSISNVVTTPSSGGTPGISTISSTGLFVGVDNANYSYFIKFNTFQASTNLWVRGCRVTYIVNKAD